MNELDEENLEEEIKPYWMVASGRDEAEVNNSMRWGKIGASGATCTAA